MSTVSDLTVLDERERLRAQIVRFDRTERIVHWATAALVITLIVAGASISFSSEREALTTTVSSYLAGSSAS